MNTTALVVEFLVVGFQTLIWIFLIFLCFFKADSTLTQSLIAFKEPLLLLSAPISYTLGVFMNGLASKIFNKLERKIYTSEKPSIMRAAILSESHEALSYLMRDFSACRIMRSTTINVFLCILSLLLHFPEKWWLILIIAILCTFLSGWAWWELTQNYYVHLKTSYHFFIQRKINHSAYTSVSTWRL